MRIGAGARKRETRHLGSRTLPAAIGEGVLSWARRLEDLGHKYLGRGETVPRIDDAGESVGDLLDGLPAGFFALHDFPSGNGTIDCVLVAPKGIFALTMQSHKGSVSVLGDQIFRNGRALDHDKALIKQAREDCLALREMLARKGITGLAPLPVIVFTDAVVGVHGTIKGIEVMHRNALPAFMKRRRDVMSARDAEAIFEFLK